MNSSNVTVQGVTAHPGTSKKTGKPYTRYEIETSGGSFSTFDSALETLARNSQGMTCAVTYEETQYGKDLQSLTPDPTAPVAALGIGVRAAEAGIELTYEGQAQ